MMTVGQLRPALVIAAEIQIKSLRLKMKSATGIAGALF